MDHAKAIAHYDDEYDLHYFNYKGMLFIENRDFYVAVYHKFGEDFSEIFTTSFDDPKYPPIKKVTRAECIYGGWDFKKQDDGILCTYYTLGDMKLNQTMVNTTLGEVAKQVVYLKEIMEKFQERNGSTQCRQLKGVDTGTPLRACPDCVADASEFLEAYL